MCRASTARTGIISSFAGSGKTDEFLSLISYLFQVLGKAQFREDAACWLS